VPPRRKRFQRTPEQLRALRQARKLAADIAKKSREGQQFGPVTEAGRAYQRATRKGEQVHGTRAAMEGIGRQPHHFLPPAPSERKMTDAEADLLADQTDAVAGRVPITYSPTATSNPADPRTAAAGYDPVTQRLLVEWGDGGTPYYYYDVPPQVWDSFQNADSPGKFINAVLNKYNYGPIDDNT
jgi:hypothetical protein